MCLPAYAGRYMGSGVMNEVENQGKERDLRTSVILHVSPPSADALTFEVDRVVSVTVRCHAEV